MEMRIANRVKSPLEILKEHINTLPEGKEIIIIFNREEIGKHYKYQDIWCKLFRRYIKNRRARTKTIKHQFGVTLKLWHEPQSQLVSTIKL